MRNPSLTVVLSEASRDGLLQATREIPGAMVGIKIAAFLLTLEGQRPGWVAEVLGLTRQSWISIVGVGTIMGRLGGGALSDRIGRAPTLIISCFVEAISIFGLLAVKGQATLYLVMLLLGLGFGGWVVLGSVILVDFFGLRKLRRTHGSLVH